MLSFHAVDEAGYFWPMDGADNYEVGGTMRVAPEAFPEVATLGALEASRANQIEPKDYDCVHGVLNSGREVTLFGVRDSRRSLTMTGARQQLRSNFAVTGSLVSPTDSVGPEVLWAGLAGPMFDAAYGSSSIAFDFDRKNPNRWSAETVTVPQLSAQLEEGVRLTFDAVPSYESDGHYVATLSQQTWFEIHPPAGAPLSYTALVNDFLIPLKALVDFCTGTSFRLVSGSCILAGQADSRAKLSLHSAAFGNMPDVLPDYERRFVLTDPSLDFQSLIQKWMPLHRSAARAFAEVSRSQVRTDSYGIVDSFVALTGAMEALHRTSPLEDARLSKSEVKWLRRAATESLEADHAEMVNEALARIGNKTFGARIGELVDFTRGELGAAAKHLDAEKSAIVAARNELVHHAERKKVDYRKMAEHNRLLRLLFVAAACRNLGLPDRLVGEAVDSARGRPRSWPPEGLPKS